MGDLRRAQHHDQKNTRQRKEKSPPMFSAIHPAKFIHTIQLYRRMRIRRRVSRSAAVLRQTRPDHGSTRIFTDKTNRPTFNPCPSVLIRGRFCLSFYADAGASMSARRPVSSRTGTPSDRAFSSFDPASSPATT